MMEIEKWDSFFLGVILGITLAAAIVYFTTQSQPSTILEPTYKWKCSKPYIYQGNYWITCEKYVCFKVENKNFCKYLGDKLKLELVR